MECHYTNHEGGVATVAQAHLLITIPCCRADPVAAETVEALYGLRWSNNNKCACARKSFGHAPNFKSCACMIVHWEGSGKVCSCFLRSTEL